MLFAGSLLALLSGLTNAAAAALEKREGMRVGTSRNGARLLAALARRPLWLFALLLSVLAWTGEAASLALAPVPAVATLRNAGRGLLVVAGGRWLGERFSRVEILGVALATTGGVLTAIGAAHARVERRPLSNLTELVVAAVCISGALVVSRLPSALPKWFPSGHDEPASGAPDPLATPLSSSAASPPPASPVPASLVTASAATLVPGLASPTPERRAGSTQAAGVAMGIAVGLLFSGTGVFTKEVGDRFALYGLGGVPAVATSAGLWLMLLMSVWSQSLLQQAFRRANAASVSAANASVAAMGLIAAGFVLYREAFPTGGSAVLLLTGIIVSLFGTGLLVSSGQAPRQEAPRPGQ
jgi:hypothetical protein